MSIRKHRSDRGKQCQVFGAVVAALTLCGCAGTAMPKIPGIPEKIEIPANDPSFRTRLYVGGAMGNSYLKPNTNRTPGFEVDGSSDVGTQLRLGVDVHNMLALEIDTSVLGAASLDNDLDSEVEYSAASASALIYGMNGVQMRSRREGWSAFGRLGYGIMTKSSQVVDLEESGAKPILGAGAEYGFANGLGIRGELTRLDDDAVFFGLGAVYRFGMSPREIGGVIAGAVEPALHSTDSRVAEGGRTLTRPGEFVQDNFGHSDAQTRPFNADNYSTIGSPSFAARVWTREAQADDADGDGIRDAEDHCGNTRANTTVARSGCGLFDSTLTEVTFKSGSSWLTPRARKELDKVSVTLLAFPEVPVQVRAHTDSHGPADMNLALSARRGEAVVKYLHSQGVHELQMQTNGVGEAEPIASNTSAEGRKRNRRIELRTLPNLTPAAFAEGHVEYYAGDDASRKAAQTAIAVAEVGEKSAVTPKPQVKKPQPKRTEPKSVSKAQVKPMPAKHKPVSKKAEPKLAAAQPAVVPPVAGVRIEPLPTPAYVAGFKLGGVVEGVSFVTGSSELTPESVTVLEAVREELLAHPTVRVAIMAHTDDQGSDDKNQLLSQHRADAVVSFLVANGVDATRLVAEGYGETLPLVQNVTAADRERNRRIEIRVVK